MVNVGKKYLYFKGLIDFWSLDGPLEITDSSSHSVSEESRPQHGSRQVNRRGILESRFGLQNNVVCD